jgi:hypothetical protein
MVSEQIWLFTTSIVRMVVLRRTVVGFTVCCEDSIVGMFADLVNSLVEKIGSWQRFFVRLMTKVSVDSVVED